MINSTELIKAEVEKFIQTTKRVFPKVKKIAIDEAWKLLQVATAAIIQIIEGIGNDLSGPEKKALALSLLDDFYENVFEVIDIPYLSSSFEKYLHKYVKSFLMLLLGSTIDSMVTIFRNTGVFLRKEAQLIVGPEPSDPPKPATVLTRPTEQEVSNELHTEL